MQQPTLPYKNKLAAAGISKRRSLGGKQAVQTSRIGDLGLARWTCFCSRASVACPFLEGGAGVGQEKKESTGPGPCLVNVNGRH